MKLMISKTNQLFLNQFGHLLNEHPERTQLLFMNAAKDLDTPLLTNQFRGAVVDQDKTVLIFLNAFPFNFQLYSIKHSPEAIQLVVEYLVSNLIVINGVQGNKKDTDVFRALYTNLTFLNFKCRLQMDIMRLNHLQEVPLKGLFRLADLHDINPMIEIEEAFF